MSKSCSSVREVTLIPFAAKMILKCAKKEANHKFKHWMPVNWGEITMDIFWPGGYLGDEEGNIR